ncbi:hypothetical protein [Glaesserella parasuis]|uniref:hypothetical protein n=1 Tax=Glaesserella parasuis TaxID=738 RepID=UPI001F48389D|nr:hypothetical protein [Glaesserella parasuis]MDG6766755.1 hypothetical protein [Glaesserella parasuis]MDG6796197.1 hypothetical protein [Glaesserella parasuis]MDG6858693.1 hypothetical protein [Glaesserella parasuis]MDG6873369.1 hypothetical protein [Glaesserella parasuis]MDO9657024.1 hypothetical protein [Glaesserella parasuis]
MDTWALHTPLVSTQRYRVLGVAERGLNVDYINSSTIVTISSYVSKDKKETGKDALSINTFTIQAVPNWDQVPYEWALSELVKRQPEDFVPEIYYGYVNPYLLDGGKIKNDQA